MRGTVLDFARRVAMHTGAVVFLYFSTYVLKHGQPLLKLVSLGAPNNTTVMGHSPTLMAYNRPKKKGRVLPVL